MLIVVCYNNIRYTGMRSWGLTVRGDIFHTGRCHNVVNDSFYNPENPLFHAISWLLPVGLKDFKVFKDFKVLKTYRQ
jgi:hypothetical protein